MTKAYFVQLRPTPTRSLQRQRHDCVHLAVSSGVTFRLRNHQPLGAVGMIWAWFQPKPQLAEKCPLRDLLYYLCGPALLVLATIELFKVHPWAVPAVQNWSWEFATYLLF